MATCNVAAGGLLKRTFQIADDVSAAKRLKAANAAPVATQVASQSMQQLASAHVGLDSLPVYLRAQSTLYQLLEVDIKAANDASPQRSAFTYVNLESKGRIGAGTSYHKCSNRNGLVIFGV